MPPQLSGKNVVVYGLGKSGLSAVRLLLRERARLCVVDAKPRDELQRSLEVAGLGASGIDLDAPTSERLARAELLVVSPGVPLADGAIVAAARAGVPVWGEIELASRFLEAPVVAVTGTNGKSTTTALTAEIFRRSGQKIFEGGNLGQPLCDAVCDGTRYDRLVVELSSFQLEGTASLRPSAAAFLNLQPDHLDRYPSLDAYAETKARIFANQGPADAAIVNADDPYALKAAQRTSARRFGFTMDETLGVAPSTLSGLARGRRSSFVLPDGARFELSNRALRGRHNVQNAMAAALLAWSSGVPNEAIAEGLAHYPGLPHRMEFVRQLDGVEWINDSKATNVDSAGVALAAFESRVWLIAGGKGKGAPYAPLVEAGRGKVQGVLTIGQDAATIGQAFHEVALVESCGTLEQAVRRARGLAKPGDTVLLSPACASYDQFKHFEDRGDQFKHLVRELS